MQCFYRPYKYTVKVVRTNVVAIRPVDRTIYAKLLSDRSTLLDLIVTVVDFSTRFRFRWCGFWKPVNSSHGQLVTAQNRMMI